jgi:hypothetical protein
MGIATIATYKRPNMSQHDGRFAFAIRFNGPLAWLGEVEAFGGLWILTALLSLNCSRSCWLPFAGFTASISSAGSERDFALGVTSRKGEPRRHLST